MGQPFLEKQRAKPVGQSTKAKPQPKVGRGIFGWVLFISTAVLMFLYLQSTPSPARAGKPRTVPLNHMDALALGAVIAGLALFIGLLAYLVRLGRRPKKVIRWHFDDTGIYTDNADSEHFASWEWVGGLRPIKGGLIIDRGLAGTRFFPDNAFDNDAERQAFLDTYARRGIRSATEVKDDRPRGFEV